MHRALIAFSVWVAAASSVSTVWAASRAPLRLAILSDLHLDPFYGTTKGICTDAVNPATNGAGTFGCDSPMDLITAAIADINSAAVGASYVVLTGDWLRHDMAEVANDTVYAFERVVEHIEQLVGDRTIPLPVVTPALGNNDFVPDYNFDVEDLGANTLLHNVSQLLTNASLIDANESTTFRQCGYYRRIVTSTGDAHAPFMVVALNTIAWSVKIPQPAPESMEDPCGQFAFLERALAEAQGLGIGVIILSHIPPALNWYSQLSINDKAAAKGDPVPAPDLYWQQRFSDRFVALVTQYKATVRLTVFGHTHRGAFIADRDMGVPMIIAGAVSPVYDNRPNYWVVQMDPDTTQLIVSAASPIQRTVDTFATGAAWHTANQTLFSRFLSTGVPAQPAGAVLEGDGLMLSMSRANHAIANDVALAYSWLNFSTAESPAAEQPCDTRCSWLLSCYGRYVRPQDVMSCYAALDAAAANKSGDEGPRAGAIVGALGCAFVFLVVFGLAYTRWARSTRRRSPVLLASSAMGGIQECHEVPEGEVLEK